MIGYLYGSARLGQETGPRLRSNILSRPPVLLEGILGDPGADTGMRESLNGRKNIYGTKKSKEQREEPLGTMSYQTSSKR